MLVAAFRCRARISVVSGSAATLWASLGGPITCIGIGPGCHAQARHEFVHRQMREMRTYVVGAYTKPAHMCNSQVHTGQSRRRFRYVLWST